MAIQNASDLLVYKITTPAQSQVTRIKVKSSTPIKDFTPNSVTDYITLNNVTDADGDITDGDSATVWTNYATNTGTNLLNKIKAELQGADFGYTGSDVETDGVWKYIDFTNGANGPVPTLEVVDGTFEFKAGAVVIDVITSGQSEVYQPIAYSTSASLSMSTDLRDITTKDSYGWQDNAKGLSSFEMSTDALWDVNNAVGVESAINDLDEGAAVDVKFSDRVRNLVATEEVYGEGWHKSAAVSTTKHLEDPFGQYTAAKYEINTTANSARVIYRLPIELFEGKKLVWTFYIKGSGSCTGFELQVGARDGSTISHNLFPTVKIISGSGTVGSGVQYIPITGLSTSTWTRIEAVVSQPVSGTDLRDVDLSMYPGADRTSQTTADEVITASWQVEIGTNATDYQNPTEVDCYQGKALVNSVSVDAGTEDNATYSASFTGTSQLFINGLSGELIGDPYFDDSTNWWSTSGAATISNGVARILWTSGTISLIVRADILTQNKKYCLQYTVSNYTSGGLILSGNGLEFTIPTTEGSHKIYFTPTGTEDDLIIKREGVTDISLTFVSLKEVFS